MSMVESVENIVVSALAQQRASMHRCPANEPDSSVVTRDIILAVADVLDTNGEDHRTTGRHGEPHMHSWSSGWLRSQANPDSAEGK